MSKDRKVIPLREAELAHACDDMEPTLAMIFDKYGAEITALALQYMAAKVIIFREGLTPESKSALIKQSSSNLKRFSRLLSSYLSSGSRD